MADYVEHGKFSDENFGMKGPEEDKVKCKDCMFRAADKHTPNGGIIKGCLYSYCEVYPKGKWKPIGILTHGEDCVYYTSEN